MALCLAGTRRSYITGAKYPLNTILHTSSRMNFEWDPAHPTEGWTNHVMDIDGQMVLEEKDMEQSDFEVGRVR